MEFISKLNASLTNINGAIILYTYGNYLSSFTISATAYNVIQDIINKKKEISTLEKFCSDDNELALLPKRIRDLWNKIKHADKEQNDLPIPQEEDARSMIVFSLLDMIRLQHNITEINKLFLLWQSASFTPVGKLHEEISKWLFPDIRNAPFEVKINYLKTLLKNRNII